MHRLAVAIMLVCTGSWMPSKSGHALDGQAGDGALPGAGQMARLQAAEVLLENVLTDESGGAARARILIHTRVENIWAQLVSCEKAFEYVDGLKYCEEIEQAPERARLRQSVKKHWLVPRMDFTVEFIRKPYASIEFRQVEGELDLLEGRWLFQSVPGPDAVLVTHEIRVKPRIPVPRWLVRRSIRKDIPDMLACLRSLAGGSGSGERAAADREKCPVQGRERP
jgi:hypothetical protein